MHLPLNFCADIHRFSLHCRLHDEVLGFAGYSGRFVPRHWTGNIVVMSFMSVAGRQVKNDIQKIGK